MLFSFFFLFPKSELPLDRRTWGQSLRAALLHARQLSCLHSESAACRASRETASLLVMLSLLFPGRASPPGNYWAMPGVLGLPNEIFEKLPALVRENNENDCFTKSQKLFEWCLNFIVLFWVGLITFILNEARHFGGHVSRQEHFIVRSVYMFNWVVF